MEYTFDNVSAAIKKLHKPATRNNKVEHIYINDGVSSNGIPPLKKGRAIDYICVNDGYGTFTDLNTYIKFKTEQPDGMYPINKAMLGVWTNNATMSALDFPNSPEMGDRITYSLIDFATGAQMAAAISDTSILNRECYNHMLAFNGKLFATNGWILCGDFETIMNNDIGNLTIPREGFKLIPKGMHRVDFYKHYVVIDDCIIMRRMEGDFPQLKRVLPATQGSNSFQIPEEVIAKAIKIKAEYITIKWNITEAKVLGIDEPIQLPSIGYNYDDDVVQINILSLKAIAKMKCYGDTWYKNKGHSAVSNGKNLIFMTMIKK